MRIAVTTNDLEHVDSSFGLTRQILIYEVTRRTTRLLVTYRFPARRPGCDRRDLGHRAAALKNCTLLYTLEIGAKGAAKAIANGVRTVRVVRPRPIPEILTTLQADLESMRPWFRGLLLSRPKSAESQEMRP